MTDYTQQEIDELTACPKSIVDPPKKAMASVQGNRRNDMVVENAEGGRFRVFMRQNEKFEEDFSVGLSYEPHDRPSIMLLRCNGPHGEFEGGETECPHYGFHVHRAKEENLRRGLKPERIGELTKAYMSFDEALRYFLTEANIEWTDEHFPGLRQKRLFEDFDDQSSDD